MAVSQFALSALRSLQNVLAPGDQYHLYTTATRALMTARRRGERKFVEYWSGRPIISISIAPCVISLLIPETDLLLSLPFIRLPSEKPMSALQSRSSDPTPILTGATDPFLYNPRRTVGQVRLLPTSDSTADSLQGQTLVVQNEIMEFVLILQNSFVFDLEFQSFSLR